MNSEITLIKYDAMMVSSYKRNVVLIANVFIAVTYVLTNNRQLAKPRSLERTARKTI